MSFDLPHKATPEQQKERFVQSLKQALIANKYSQRELCEALGITIGTLTKYLRGAVDPSKVGVAIMRNLAKELGFTTNTLLNYFETGEYQSSLTIDDVASWIRSEAGHADLPVLLTAMSQTTESLAPVGVVDAAPAVSAWNGYTDDESREFCSNMQDAIKQLCSAAGTSVRGVWALVEEKLSDLKLSPEEIDLCWEVAIGGKFLSGDELTAARSLFMGRGFEMPCPLNVALSEFKELSDSKSLGFCRELCLSAG